jgi:hypothetical protein
MTAGGDTLVYAPNRPQGIHLALVTEEMRVLGPPRIRAYWTGDYWLALEGSHRLAAAKNLSLTPQIVSMRLKDSMRHDYADLRSRRVAKVVEYLTKSGLGPHYYFADLSRP